MSAEESREAIGSKHLDEPVRAAGCCPVFQPVKARAQYL